jgi:hypothetical protein
MTRWTTHGVPFAPAYRADYTAAWTDLTADPQGRTHRIVWNADTDLRYSVQLDGVELSRHATMTAALSAVAEPQTADQRRHRATMTSPHNRWHLDYDCPTRVLGSLHTGDTDRVTCPDCLDRYAGGGEA